jgi:hypothetical protein
MHVPCHARAFVLWLWLWREGCGRGAVCRFWGFDMLCLRVHVAIVPRTLNWLGNAMIDIQGLSVADTGAVAVT